MAFTVRARGGRIVHSISYTIAAPINSSAYTELDDVLPDEVALADEVVITSSGDTAIWIATGGAGSESNKIPMGVGDTILAISQWTNIFSAGERVSFQKADAATLDGGIITLTFISLR